MSKHNGDTAPDGEEDTVPDGAWDTDHTGNDHHGECTEATDHGVHRGHGDTDRGEVHSMDKAPISLLITNLPYTYVYLL
ncbi:hypothetical protein OESDEN_02045 [Oesophagostomum dentatum]|uniref:Uncharacterized protein n=1 Tax=Oesophagostomum dentatum TaxID=61180 RepID=A0A0B1TQ57_OESDE|nr:hypothetical protein OESDEN_02045 [Oesophagostomum dentatum]